MGKTFNQLADELHHELQALYKRYPDLDPSYTPVLHVRFVFDASPALDAMYDLKIALDGLI